MDDRARNWLLYFWDCRSGVSGDERCPTPLSYPDGSTGQCVLSRAHLDGEALSADVPHADKDGRIAPLLVSWTTIREVRMIAENPLP